MGDLSDTAHLGKTHVSNLTAAYTMRSRGIVIFKDNYCLVWQNDDGDAVQKWAQSFDTPKSDFARQHGGVFHAVVYTVGTGFVSYEMGD